MPHQIGSIQTTHRDIGSVTGVMVQNANIGIKANKTDPVVLEVSVGVNDSICMANHKRLSLQTADAGL